jgi:FG-GAP repeat protein/VCBS repeat protein
MQPSFEAFKRPASPRDRSDFATRTKARALPTRHAMKHALAVVVVSSVVTACGSSVTLDDEPGMSGGGASGPVREHVDGDVSGDAIPDLVVGVVAKSPVSAVGWVYRVDVFFGPVTESATLDEADVTLIGGAGAMGFGTSIALGDLDADGIDDILVGADAAAGERGAVYVFRGGALESRSSADADARILGTRPDGLFGSAVHAADVNGDGIDDLVVGAPGQWQDVGAVFVFHGGSTAIASDLDADAVVTGAEPRFGSALATGDVNDDGRLDLLVGADDAELAYLHLGDGSGDPGSKPAMILDRGVRFGIGDLTGDGRDDIAFHHTNHVDIYAGGPAVVSDPVAIELEADYWVESLAIGDIVGDATPDLVLGATSGVRIFEGGAKLADLIPPDVLVGTDVDTSNWYGEAVGVADLGTGAPRLLVGDWSAPLGHGPVLAFAGDAMSPTMTTDAADVVIAAGSTESHGVTFAR